MSADYINHFFFVQRISHAVLEAKRRPKRGRERASWAAFQEIKSGPFCSTTILSLKKPKFCFAIRSVHSCIQSHHHLMQTESIWIFFFWPVRLTEEKLLFVGDRSKGFSFVRNGFFHASRRIRYVCSVSITDTYSRYTNSITLCVLICIFLEKLEMRLRIHLDS